MTLTKKLILICLSVGAVVLYAYLTGNEPALIVFKAVVTIVFISMLPYLKRVWDEG